MKHHSTPITDQLLKQFKTMSQTKHTPAVTRVKYFLKNNRNNDAIEQIVYIPKLLIQVPDVKAYLKGLHPDPTGFGSIKYSFMVDTIIHYFERTIEDETAAERDRLKEENEELQKRLDFAAKTLGKECFINDNLKLINSELINVLKECEAALLAPMTGGYSLTRICEAITKAEKGE